MTMKTKNYDMFKFRSDNRVTIHQRHVKRLVESIESRNLLELRPICVNEDMEIIDGQHRLMAAQILGVDIYYNVEKKIKSEDIILMNIAKSWNSSDYLNYYCKNGYEEYRKLEKFLKEHAITIKIGLSITMGESDKCYEDFRHGKYVFSEVVEKTSLDICWYTIGQIKKFNGFSIYTSSSRFWKAILKLVNHPDFDIEKWKHNLTRLIDRFGPRASTNDYYKLLMDVNNWKNSSKINLLQDEE